MTLVSTEIIFDAPIEPVFDLVTTTRHWPQWHPATEAVSGVTDRPLRAGDQVRERAVIGGRAHEGTWTVTDYIRPEHLTLEIDAGRIAITYAFGAVEGGTSLRRELRYRPQDFAGGASDPDRLEAHMAAQSAEALRRLKHLVEHQLPLERNKAIVRSHLERVFNRRDVDGLEEVFTSDAAIHDPGTDFTGPAHLRAGLAKLFEAFPDFHFTVLEEVAEDNRVVIRYRGEGTHHGEFLGIAPTGARIDYFGLLLVRVDGERIASFWAQPDQLGLLRQLGGGGS